MPMTRELFKELVFKRANGLCEACLTSGAYSAAKDAHHVLERRLWPDGGYYLDNGVALCHPCHYRAETTEYSCSFLREAAGISKILLPPHLYDDQEYDKWGNPVLPNGQRLRGELFEDESVQKVISNYLHLFTTRVKYPRTYHLPWSPGVSKDDRVMRDWEVFDGKEVVITLKMDGENTTMYSDYLHARSLEFSPHESRNFVKKLHGSISYNIPEGWRVCGENLYAKHSIQYTNLDSYFLGFSVWNEKNMCLSWSDTVEWLELLELTPVPVLYKGVWSESVINDIHSGLFLEGQEGYVVRLASSFHYKDFRYSVAKYVRANHVAVHGGHWANRIVVPNVVK